MVETKYMTADPLIKVIDFGLAKYFDTIQRSKMSSILGTPYYIAPEVIQGSYDQSCDVWSIGVIAYCLLAGYPPFNADTEKKLFDKIISCDFMFHPEDWKNIDPLAKEFIYGALDPVSKNRMTPVEALNHPWIKKYAPNNLKQVESRVIQSLISCPGFNSLQRHILHILTSLLNVDEIRHIRNAF